MEYFIAWVNENEGFLMVAITFVYVIATIFICVFNWLSAMASRDQIITSQKQQEQNAELHLYTIRLEIINKIWKRQFEEVFWDVHILFDKGLSDKFDLLFQEDQKLKKIQIEIEYFEEELKIILPERTQIYAISQISDAKTKKRYNELKDSLRKMLTGIGKNEQGLELVEEYIENLKRIDELQKNTDKKTLSLILELREYMQKSIQLK